LRKEAGARGQPRLDRRAAKKPAGRARPPPKPHPETFRPQSLLLPYQLESRRDPARFIFDLWSRQTGKDFTASEAIVTDCHRTPKNTWLIAAPSERQSLETLAKCREWSEAYGHAIADVTETREGGAQSILKAGTIAYPNGSRIIAVPGRPETVRGFSANVLLTEFAYFEQVNETWKALLPSISNSLRGGVKKVRVITTPNGKGNKVWDLWEKNFVAPDPARRQRWSCRKVTIHDAVRDGLARQSGQSAEEFIAELREAMDDPEGWAQEFECDFIDGSNVLLPYDVIAQAESADSHEFCDPAFWETTGGNPVTLGIDFGRSHDPTVCWALERVGDVEHTREVLVERGMSTPDQVRMLEKRCARATRVAVDYTGPGIGLGDYLVQKFQQWKPPEHKFGKIELCTFTTDFKRKIFPRLRTAFEAPTKVRIPISTAVREDLHAMQQIVRHGDYTYAAPRTAEGHSDRCTALALARHASGGEQTGRWFAVCI